VNQPGYHQTIMSTGGTGTVTYSEIGSLPTGLTLSSSGVLSGTPTTAGNYSFTVMATDTTGASDSGNYNLVINSAVTVYPIALSNWSVNQPGYTQTIIAIGGTGSKTVATTAGTLPTGLTLSSAGILSGTPTAAGGFTFTVTATDTVGATGSQSYTLTINPLLLVTTNADSGSGSLRQAIETANTQTGLTTIDFAINTGVQTIVLDSALPPITAPVVLDGTSQPGFNGTPLIVLTANPTLTVGEANSGLEVQFPGCTIKGLVVNNWGTNIQIESHNDVVEGDFLGTDATGTANGNTGPNIGNGTDLVISGNNNTIGGTTSAARNIISGNADGIQLEDENNLIEGNFIGTDVTGTVAVGYHQFGIIGFSAGNSTIGGTAPGAGNVISGCFGSSTRANYGLWLSNSSGDVVQGNKIGTNAAGNVALPNGNPGETQASGGILVTGGNNTIGGTAPGAGNLISGNYGAGITLMTEGESNLIQGNVLGTDISGTAAMGNSTDGVTVSFPGNVTINGNLISGNGRFGVFLQSTGDSILQGNKIGTNASGSAALPNGADGVFLIDGNGNTIGGTTPGAGNLISGNNEFGILLAGTSGTLIQDNRIGTDVVGTVAVPNAFDGIYVLGASGNTIAGNLVSGNGRFGVFLLGESTTNGIVSSSSNLVQDNVIGLGQGAGNLPNADDGVALFAGAIDNTIGGATPGTGNLISGNGRFGVYVNGAGTTGNLIQGNRIGTSVDATFGQGNTLDGIAVFAGPSDNTIGGTAALAGNIISGNGRDGIFLANAGSGNAILGNFIGTSGDGSKAVGNSGNGVALESVTGTTIGGTTGAAANVISGNTEGVVLVGSGASDNLVEGNLIGTDKTGSAAVANTVFGMDVQAGASGNIIGGTASGASNIIAFNGRTGVVIGNSPADTTTIGDSILGNSIFGNVFQGIDLGNDGPTANTSGGPHSGPNDLQNFPTISSVAASGSGTAITAALRSTPGHTFRIELFADTDGQGRTFLGAGTLTTDGTGNGRTTIAVASTFASLVGKNVTATATDRSTGDTSEFGFPAFTVAGT